MRVRLLGEDLVAFRDTRDRIGLIDEYCPHRRASLFFGRNEECGLRCVYHGWKFDVDGRCVDMMNAPETLHFKDRIFVASYPTVEAGGILWAYLGPPERRPAPPTFAWTQTPATHRHVSKVVQEKQHQGTYFQFDVLPKPYQKPHPPIRMAATTRETYALVGTLGLPIFIAVRTTPVATLEECITSYHEAWKAAGHPGRGQVAVIVPVYVADSARAAREEPEASTMEFFRAVGAALQQTAGSTGRSAEGARLARLPYDDILREFAVYGTPEAVTDRLIELREALGYSSLSVWMNSGGQIAHERVMRSMRLFAERVMPASPSARRCSGVLRR